MVDPENTVKAGVPSKVRAALETCGLMLSEKLVIVAVSGGPDSVALLLALHTLQPSFGYRLHVAHYNHCLRGEQSEQDALYVSALAKTLGLPMTLEAGDVRALAKRRKLGLEEAARVARYGFFAQLSHHLDAAAVAVAHTADDQVETVVMRLLRGTGLAGLRGMALVTTVTEGPGPFGKLSHGLTIVRPLLHVARTEVEAYLEERSTAAREDLSNLDKRFLRNRVRLEVIPFLEGYNPRFRAAIERLAETATEDYAYIEAHLLAVWPQLATVKDDAVRLDLAQWLALPHSLRHYALRYAAEILLGDALDIGAEHLRRAADAMQQGPVGTTIEWPRDLRVVKGYDGFQVRKGERPRSNQIEGTHQLTIPGETTIEGTPMKLVAQIKTRRCFQADEDPWHADLDWDATGPQLYVRSRHAGDVIRPLGMKQEKKVQDLLVDAKVPRAERDALPVIATRAAIVWVAGIRIDDRFKITSHTSRVLCLSVVGYNKVPA